MHSRSQQQLSAFGGLELELELELELAIVILPASISEAVAQPLRSTGHCAVWCCHGTVTSSLSGFNFALSDPLLVLRMCTWS